MVRRLARLTGHPSCASPSIRSAPGIAALEQMVSVAAAKGRCEDRGRRRTRERKPDMFVVSADEVPAPLAPFCLGGCEGGDAPASGTRLLRTPSRSTKISDRFSSFPRVSDRSSEDHRAVERSPIISCVALPQSTKETLMKLKQECHGPRRRLHSRALLGSLVLASASLSACVTITAKIAPRLQAILQDGELTQVMRQRAHGRRPRQARARRAQAAPQPAPAARRAPPARPGRAARVRAPRNGGRRGRDWHGRLGPTRSFPGQAQGFWRFDDCNMSRTELADSTFGGNQRRSAR